MVPFRLSITLSNIPAKPGAVVGATNVWLRLVTTADNSGEPLVARVAK
jgi:hypothetical protein